MRGCLATDETDEQAVIERARRAPEMVGRDLATVVTCKEAYVWTDEQSSAYGSPRLLHRGEVYFSYAHAQAQGSGAVSGGLTDFSPPESGYFQLDHDQRHTLHAGFNFDLPHRIVAGGNLYYGSGFTDGSIEVPAHLPGHTTFDLTVGKALSENLTISVTALNLMNRRFLLDNSETFGGTHYADPRQVYLQVKYRFHY